MLLGKAELWDSIISAILQLLDAVKVTSAVDLSQVIVYFPIIFSYLFSLKESFLRLIL